MDMGKGEKPILSVRIDRELLEAVDALADEAGVGRAEVVERCLSMGVADHENLVKWLKTPIVGVAVRLLTHPEMMKAIFQFFGGDYDPTSLKVRNAAIANRKRPKLKPATE
jgi:Ribbon-helix-helix protein, copG family